MIDSRSHLENFSGLKLRIKLARVSMNKTIEKIKHYIKENLTALAWVIVIAVSMYYYVSLMFGD